MAAGRLSDAARLQRRRATAGQGLVEFALVGSVFFFMLFSIMNAGFFLFGRNAIQHAADIGVATFAAEGNASGGDAVAFSRMDAAGLTTTPFISVTEVDLFKEVAASDGTLSDDTSCGGVCENIYNKFGTASQTRWAETTRNAGENPDYAKLVIKYTYRTFAANTTFSLTTNNTFRLEPQG